MQWRFVYCGFFDRTDPDGKTWGGLKSVEQVIARLTEENAKLTDPKQPLRGWSLDPIYFDNRRVTRQDLRSGVDTDRPIGIMHASGHIMNVNTKALGTRRHAAQPESSGCAAGCRRVADR